MSCPPKCAPKPVAKGLGFLNFMKDYRKRVCGLPAFETKKRGERAWQRLSCIKRESYRTLHSRKPCPRPKRCSPMRRRSSSGPRESLMRAGASQVSFNVQRAYYNFVSCFCQKHTEFTHAEAKRRAKNRWCRMNRLEKARFK